MALNFASMLLQPSAVSPWNLSGGGDGSAREQLKLMREKFEWEKKRAEEEDRLAREKMGAEQAAAELTRQREEEAKTLAARRAAQSEFSKKVADRDFEGAEAFIPQLEMLGGGVDITRSPTGFPSYRIHDDARKDAQTEEHNRLLMREMASPEFDEPAPPIDPVTGHVLDTAAMQQQTLQRLSPYLESQVASYPEGPYQDSAARTRQGVEALGLSAEESATRFRADRAGVDSAIKDTLDAEEAAKPKELDAMQESTLRGHGETRAEKAYSAQKVPEALAKRREAETLLKMLDKPDPTYAQLLGPAIMSVAGVKGAQSNMDMLETLGLSRQTAWEQAAGWIEQKLVSGGFTEKQKNAFREWLNEAVDMTTKQAFDFMDTARQRIDKGSEHEAERTGWRNFLLTIPPDIREEYELYRHDAGDEEAEADVLGDPRSAELASGSQYDPEPVTSDFDIELESLAMENDLDPEKIAPIVGKESGGKAGAISSEGASGVLQIMPDNLRAMGIDPEEYRKLSAVEQLPAVLQFLKAQGLTSDSSAEDYVMAVAASDPKFRAEGASDDMVVYKKGSAAWRANAPWRPPDGGDITRGSILAYYGLRGKKRSKDKNGGGAASPEAQTPAEKRYLELLKKRGG
jgi:hypothetical protein